MASPPSSPVRADPARDTTLIGRARRGLPLTGPLLVYLILILFGVTTSNIGIDSLRQDPDAPLGVQLGHTQGIRSDEYGTGSPLWLGEIARGGAEQITPLSAPAGLLVQLPDGIVSSIVFFEGTALALGSALPTEMLFAMKWWLPTLLLFLGLPIWFRQVTGRLRWGYFAAFLIAVAPGNVWWSGLAVNTIGFVAAACALTIFSSSSLAHGRYVRAGLGFVVAGVLFARTPTYYQPFAIMLSVPFVVATALFILRQDYRLRARIISIAAIVVAGVAWTGSLLWESRDVLAAGLTTVYPGTRLSAGSPVAPGFALGATNLFGIYDPASVALTNQSELSTSFTLLIAVTVLLCVLGGSWWTDRPFRAVFLTMAVATLFWLAWISIDWGTWSSAIPLVNRVPPARAALGVGFLATIAFSLLMSRYRPRNGARWVAASAAAVLAGGLSVTGGILLQTGGFLPDLGAVPVAVAATVCGAAVFAVVGWPGRVWSMAFASLSALSLTLVVSPVIFGVGDLRDSTTAKAFLDWADRSRSDGTVWASDSTSVDSLMMATGVPALSGRQLVGPVVSEWEKLDPGRANENIWNRGGAHVVFEWADDGLRFEQPFPDVIKIVASPCEVHERLPELTYVVSSRALDASCLSEVDILQWSGEPQHVYVIEPTE